MQPCLADGAGDPGSGALQDRALNLVRGVGGAADVGTNLGHPRLNGLGAEFLAGWRSFDIVEIADAMKQSGISLEQLLESVKKQTRPTS